MNNAAVTEAAKTIRLSGLTVREVIARANNEGDLATTTYHGWKVGLILTEQELAAACRKAGR